MCVRLKATLPINVAHFFEAPIHVALCWPDYAVDSMVMPNRLCNEYIGLEGNGNIFAIRNPISMSTLKKLIHTILSISGFVPEHMTFVRIVFMLGSVLMSVFLLPEYSHIQYAIAYFVCSTIVYLGFIYLVLPEKGLRLPLIEKFGEERAYLYYEGFLAFAFFHNGASLTFISQSSAGSGFWVNIPDVLLISTVFFLFVIGLGIKIWAAYVVGIPVYYWKDMFFGRGVSHFVETGPYKYFNNPMYGIGQVQVYAIALYYNSVYGLIFGVINQLLVFLFYYTVEKPFIYRTYIRPQKERIQ